MSMLTIFSCRNGQIKEEQGKGKHKNIDIFLLVFKDNQVSTDNISRHVMRFGESRVFSVMLR